MSKMKIEIRKPQYLSAKEAGASVSKSVVRSKTPVFFRLLLASSYVLSVLAIWYVYQKISAHS